MLCCFWQQWRRPPKNDRHSAYLDQDWPGSLEQKWAKEHRHWLLNVDPSKREAPSFV